MIIYKVSGKEGYLELQFKNYDSDKELIRLLSEDRSVKKEWGTPAVNIITKGKKTDCPFFWVGTRLAVVSEKAKDELKDVWEADNIELLPLICDDIIYYILHIMQTENISFDFADDYSIVFNKSECKKHRITDKFLFRSHVMENARNKSIFVTEKFIERIKKSDLKGFGFKKIWEE
ncbi:MULTISPECIES: hypothetical protein [unclassified Clostridium]|uniref:hypothetical protein n=1 Tax=unclassified Clostridium TaxID=2614128 RepID=UPI001DE265F5|nr:MULTISPECIES: hypothetical protein [unclassified Clostridium]MBN1045258.1 hypothetical protein [Clostridium botulinum]